MTPTPVPDTSDNVFGTPTMVMFDESGQVRRLMDYKTPEDLEKAIDRILGRQEIEQTSFLDKPNLLCYNGVRC